MSIRRWISAASCAFLLTPAPASALDPKVRLTQYHHTAWRVQDGYFAAAPTAIAQTADGYIWIATGAGLVRYDGVRFVPWTPPGETAPYNVAVYSLLSSSDGTLWIGTSTGLSSWKNNTLEQHVRGRINAIIEDRQHRIWVARSRVPDASGGLCLVTGDQPRCIGGDERLRLPYAVTLSEDVGGNLWVGSSGQLLRWREDSHRGYFREELSRFEGLQAITSVMTTNDGTVWAAIPRVGFGVFRVVNGVSSKLAIRAGASEDVSVLFADRDQSVWMGTTNSGIYRVTGDRVDHLRSEGGLSSNSVTQMFEDREGNLWVATSKGLDRFRETRIVTFSTAEGLAANLAGSILASTDGRVWIGNRGSLDVIQDDRATSIPLPGQNVNALWQDHSGRLWVGLDNELAIYQDGQFQYVRGLDGNRLIGAAVAIAEDRDHNIWVTVIGARRRLLRIRNLAVEEELSMDQIPYARTLAADPGGGIWLGHLNGHIGHYRSGKLQTIPLQLGDAPVSGLIVDGDGSVWASTQRGLAHWKDGRLKTLTRRNGLPCDAVAGAVRDRESALWLYMKCGVIAIENAEVERWLAEPLTTIRHRVFDVLDGAMPDASTFQPGVARSPDGRLWFVNESVVQMVDPGALRMNVVAPPVYVEGLRADRNDYPADSVARLAAHSRDIEIRYTALSFAIPEKVRFRYRLDGRDTDWHEAGTRRQAFYNDLPPGQYRFRVIASNNDGVWNETGATMSFVIAQAYYQTPWFFSVVAATALSVAWSLYRLRVRIFERNQRDMSALNERLMKVQEQERVRIAGELHDGVMQEMLAATMMLGSAKRRTSEDSEAHGAIDKVQQKLIRMGTDLRQLSHELHPPALQEAGLPKAVQDYCDEFSGACGIPMQCDTDPGVDDLSRGTSLALFRILQEALGNAAKHSQAKLITVRLLRTGAMVILVIADNGAGFDRSRLGPTRGLGLITIRERAAQLNGTFECDTAVGRGTTITVAIPYR